MAHGSLIFFANFQQSEPIEMNVFDIGKREIGDIMFEAKKNLPKYSRSASNYRLTPSMSSSLPNSHADGRPPGQYNRNSSMSKESEIMFSPNRGNSTWFPSFNESGSSKTSPSKKSPSRDNSKRSTVAKPMHSIGSLSNGTTKVVTSKYFPFAVSSTTTSPRKRLSREVPSLPSKKKLSSTTDSKPVTIIDSSPSPPPETTPTSAPPTFQAAITVEVSSSTANSSHSSTQSHQEFNDTNLAFPSESVHFEATPPQSKVSAICSTENHHVLSDHSYHQQSPQPVGDTQMHSKVVDCEPVQHISIEEDQVSKGSQSGKDQKKSPQSHALPSKGSQPRLASRDEYPQLSKEGFHFTVPLGDSSGSALVSGGGDGGGSGDTRKRKHSSGDEVSLSAPFRIDFQVD